MMNQDVPYANIAMENLSIEEGGIVCCRRRLLVHWSHWATILGLTFHGIRDCCHKLFCRFERLKPLADHLERHPKQSLFF